MRCSIYTIAAILSSMTVSAEHCVQGFDYCGYALISQDATYRTAITDQLQVAGRPTSDMQMTQSLFSCNAEGQIEYKKYCINGCGRIMDRVNQECLRK